MARRENRRPQVEALEDRTLPAIITVTTLANSGVGSLRQAILDANATTASDSIRFQSGLAGTIQLTSALPALTGEVDVLGNFPVTLRRDAATAFRLITVASGARVELSRLTFTNGKGAVSNAGILRVADCTFTGNVADTGTAGMNGGAINNAGSLTVTRSRFETNAAAFNGGAIMNNLGASAVVENSAFLGNTATQFNGGAVASNGTLGMLYCTVSGNHAGRFGGGVWQGKDGAAYLNHLSILLNDAGNADASGRVGGGVYAEANAPVFLANALIAGNLKPGNVRDDVAGAVAGTFNIVGDGTGLTGLTDGQGGNQIKIDYDLVFLGIDEVARPNGSGTLTHALFPGSPALDAGGYESFPSGSPLGFDPEQTMDQRGAPPLDLTEPNAPGGNGRDVGAFEYQRGTVVVNSLGDELSRDTVITFREAMLMANSLAPAWNFYAGPALATQVIGSPGDETTIHFAPDLAGAINIASPLYDVTRSVSIEGPGADRLTVRRSGAEEFRLFRVRPGGGDLFLSGLTLAEGRADGEGGGAVLNEGSLTASQVSFENNRAANGGGAIRSTVIATVRRSTFANNTATVGGAIDSSGQLIVSDSTFSSNAATVWGGGLYLQGGSVALAHVTLTGNRAVTSGGIGGGGGLAMSEGFSILLNNSLVAGNHRGFPNVGNPGTPDDVRGALHPFQSLGNLIGVDTEMTGVSDGVRGNRVGTSAAPLAPRVGPLSYNGGPTRTHALLLGSPAEGIGRRIGFTSADQRGVVRSMVVDAGAFEFVPPEVVSPPPPPPPSPAPAPAGVTAAVLRRKARRFVAIYSRATGAMVKQVGPFRGRVKASLRDLNGDGILDVVIESTRAGKKRFQGVNGLTLVALPVPRPKKPRR